MYQFSEITTVHLEITSKCNVSCPMCLRNISGGAVNPQLPLVELSLEDIKHLFPLSFLKQLKRLYMCGNYGDPMVARDTLEIFQFIREIQPSIHLSMFTNGSGRKTSWWKKLGAVVDQVHFAIDGLEDTLPIYRRQANFKKIMESAESYISGGGKAIWDYIVFRHNEHQVEEAGKLAEDMGFDQFVVKKTGRFFSNQKNQVKTSQQVLNKKGEVEYLLEPPENAQYQNRSLQKEEQLSKEYGSIHNYLNQTEIQCRVSKEKNLYVSAEGFVFPCCWIANQLYPWYFKKRSSQIWKFIDQLPEKENSLNGKIHPIKKIVQGDFFQTLVPESWSKKDITKDKLRVCAKTCGKKFTSFDDQFK
ncbi:MAG: radical SAM protein [Bdellovibrionales bacterium]|nr:radical SAM protein [Bdellovibrionales bacterium]